MSVELCKTLALTLDDSDLAKCWKLLHEESQTRSEKRAIINKGKLATGSIVEWTARGKVYTGVVDRVKRKKALVYEHVGTSGKISKVSKASSTRWDIPLGLLNKIS
jgi:hypothetical protein